MAYTSGKFSIGGTMDKLKNLGIGQRIIIIIASVIVVLLGGIIADVNMSTKDLTLSISDTILSQNGRTVSSTLSGWLDDRMIYLGMAASNPMVIEAARGATMCLLPTG